MINPTAPFISFSCEGVGLKKRRPFWIGSTKSSWRSHGVNSILQVDSLGLAAARMVLVDMKRMCVISASIKLLVIDECICKH